MEFGFFLIGGLLVGAIVSLIDYSKRINKREKRYNEKLDRIAMSLKSIEKILNIE